MTRDTSAATDAIQGFVDAYNSYSKTVGTLSSYDKDTGQARHPARRRHARLGAAPDLQPAGQQGGRQQHRFAGRAGHHPPGRTARLALDSDRLASALNTNGAAVQDLFAGTNGYATRLNKALDAFTASGGVIGTRQQSLTDSLSKLDTQQTQLDAPHERVREATARPVHARWIR